LFNQKYWGRLKRKEWLVNGDRNTKFFHQRALVRRKKQTIVKLKTDDGIWVDDPQDIASQFIADYQARFTTTGRGSLNSMAADIRPVISEIDNIELVKLPDQEEVKYALFCIEANKTLSSDGFGAGFFKHYWDLVKDDFFQCILEFFRNGKLLKQINHTFIALIPKVENPTQMNHFRPISLCSTVYKTISKILVNRLRPLLTKIVSPTQSAFFAGRAIHGNSLITYEIMH